MEKNTQSWFPHTQLRSLFPDPNLSRFTFDKAQQNISPDFRNPLSVEDRMPYQFKASGPSNSTNWFYHMPNPHQAFAPPLNASHKEQGQQKSPMTFTSSSPKRFLVFDQSGEKTTLMLTSGPVHCGTYGLPNNFSVPYSLYKEVPIGNLSPLRPLVNDGENIEDDNFKDVTEDDMREDTEELNALLYSDSEDYSEGDDDEASTGHSPSVMTNDHVMDLTDDTGDEVDSLSKRQKLSNGHHRTTSNYNRDKRSFKTSVLGDAAESCFRSGSGHHQRTQDWGSVSCGKKRPRKEKLLETVSVLQSIIPGSNRKDALLVIDEAIHYLKSIKAKAKTLRLDAL